MRLTKTSNNIEYFIERGIEAKVVDLEELVPSEKRAQISPYGFVLYRRGKVRLKDKFNHYTLNVTKKLKKYPRLILCNTQETTEQLFTVWFPPITVSNGYMGFLYQIDSDTDFQKTKDLIKIKNFYIL